MTRQSVETKYTERGEPHENEKEETFNQGGRKVLGPGRIRWSSGYESSSFFWKKRTARPCYPDSSASADGSGDIFDEEDRRVMIFKSVFKITNDAKN